MKKFRTLPADGHTHNFTEGATRTSFNDGHSHPIRPGSPRTGLADGHTHELPKEAITMTETKDAKLSAAQRKKLKGSQFCGPGRSMAALVGNN